MTTFSVTLRGPLLVVVIILLGSLVSEVSSARTVFPWNAEIQEQRTRQLLEDWKKKPFLELAGDTIIESLKSIPTATYISSKQPAVDGQLLIKTENGTEYIGTLQSTAVLRKKKLLKHDKILSNSRHLSKLLESTCSVLPRDYWNYQWCHR